MLAVTLVVAALWGRWLGLYYSYDWWGSAVVFFSMVTNIVVNIGCGVYFFRFRRQSFIWAAHGLVPVLGIITSLIPLVYSFGPDLWNLGWKRGQSIILFCVFLTICALVYSLVLSFAKPELFRKSPEVET